MTRGARGATLARHLQYVAVGAVCALLVIGGGAREAHAQGVDPRGGLRTLPTTHFRVHFRAEHEAQARMLATYAEQAWTAMARELVTPAFPIDLLFADNVDDSNGYAQLFPSNRIVIYAVPPVGLAELRFHDQWLRLVVSHELAHIFHIDRAAGLWRVGRWVFGRNALLFPNALTPSWVKEGIAVHYESQISGSGRNVSTESRTVARAAARAEQVPAIARWSATTSQFPRGQTPYAWGSLLMHRAAIAGGDSSMRRFVNYTAGFPIPFLLDRASRIGFGTSFSSQFSTMRDSLQAVVAAMDTSGDAAWRMIDSSGWYATSPRWRGTDSLIWSGSNGRDVTGLFTASAQAPVRVVRVARRNSLDANVPFGVDSTLFAQLDFRDLYVTRSDLYVGQGRGERRLTVGARLTQPDMHRDGQMVAVQVAAASTRLVLVTRQGAITPLTQTNIWAEPRWSPDGSRLAAIEFLPSGEERVVVLSAAGVVQQVVTGGLAVFASPSFTGDGQRLVWSSDRSGRMQLETARIGTAAVVPDTMGWRDERDAVRVASHVTTGVYEPTVSPDGRWVAALLYRVDGSHVAVAPLDTTGPVARNLWYAEARKAVQTTSTFARNNVAMLSADSSPPTAGATHRYMAARQLVPRYWMPIVGEGRGGAATYGLASSGNDIVLRHAWAADVAVNPATREVDADATYRYAGLGIPLIDLDWSQAWDGPFTVVNDKGGRIGDVARRRRFATAPMSFLRPRIRRTVSSNLGVQYESRDFTADVDSVLGPAESLLRRGTRYPLLFAGASFSTTRRAARAISVEEGFAVGLSGSYRWREDQPSLGSVRGILTGRGYVPLDLPGFARHVLRTYVALGAADTKTATGFSVGGVSGVASALLPGIAVGDPSRLFPVRGVAPGVQRGIRAIAASAEYRAPLVMFRTLPSPFTIFADRMSMSVFTDAARAWCPSSLARTSTPVCERPGARDGWIASAGAELTFDLALQYDAAFRLRLGVAAPYLRPADVPRRGAFYVTLGSLF